MNRLIMTIALITVLAAGLSLPSGAHAMDTVPVAHNGDNTVTVLATLDQSLGAPTIVSLSVRVSRPSSASVVFFNRATSQHTAGQMFLTGTNRPGSPTLDWPLPMLLSDFAASVIGG